MDKVAGPEIRLNAAPARPRTCRIAGYVLLAVLVLLALARVPYAATHLDLARDIFVAWRFLHGEEVPLAGPVLAATIHLGPAWYWLLAALLALTRSWLGVLLLLGVLSALLYPLAYLAGKELHSRGTGLLWAVLLGAYATAFIATGLTAMPPLVLILVLWRMHGRTGSADKGQA